MSMTESKDLPHAVFNKMMDKDYFSKWMNVELLDIGPGHCTLSMQVRKEMLNGFGIIHGGVSFALADSALAFAANSHGRLSVSIRATMTYTNPATTGEVIIAEATEQHLGNKTATYDIQVEKDDGSPICLLRGTVYRTSQTVLNT